MGKRHSLLIAAMMVVTMGAYIEIQEDGVARPRRQLVNFTGSVDCTDGSGKTTCNFTGGGAGEANTHSSDGGGLALTAATPKVGVDLRLVSVAAADFDSAADLITIDDTKWAKDSEIDDVPEAGDYTNLSAVAPIANSPTGTITTSMATSRLIGRTTAGAGVMEEITVSSPLTFSALTLDITAIADADLASSYSGVGACGANTWASTLNDNAAPTCTQPAFTNISGTASDAQVDGSLETGEVVGTETDEAICSWEATGTIIECDLVVNAGTALTADLEEEAHCSEHDSADVDCSGETILIAAGAVSADELDEAGVEAGLEGVLDLLDLQDGAADACTGLEVVRRNAGDTAFECAAASGGVTDAEYIVGEAHAGLSAEVAPSADDQIPLSSSSTAAVWVAMPNCNTENHLTYATGTNTFGCEADDGGGGGGLSYAQVAAAVMAGF